MEEAQIEALARAAAKSIKIEKGPNGFSRMLKKATVETALDAEMDGHPGYGKHQYPDNSNSRNGYSSKTLIGDDGTFDTDVPRGRGRHFGPQLVKKHQTRFTGMDGEIPACMPKVWPPGKALPASKANLKALFKQSQLHINYLQGSDLI